MLMGRWRIAQKVLYEVELTYEDFNFRQFESFGLVWFGGAAPPLIPPPTDEVLRKLLPENVEVPSSMEQVGHILHVNLGEEQLPHKKVIGEVLLDVSRSFALDPQGVSINTHAHTCRRLLDAKQSCTRRASSPINIVCLIWKCWRGSRISSPSW